MKKRRPPWPVHGNPRAIRAKLDSLSEEQLFALGKAPGRSDVFAALPAAPQIGRVLAGKARRR